MLMGGMKSEGNFRLLHSSISRLCSKFRIPAYQNLVQRDNISVNKGAQLGPLYQGHKMSFLTFHRNHSEKKFQPPVQLSISPNLISELDISDEHDKLSIIDHSTSVRLPSQYPQPQEGHMNLIDNGQIKSVKSMELYGPLRRINSESILETFAASYRFMDKVHFALCLKRLFAISGRLKGDLKKQFVQSLQNDSRFQNLCAVIARKAPNYEATLAFDMFRFLTALGSSDNHPAVQIYLQLLRHLLNDLHLDQLMQLCYTVHQMTPTKNTRMIMEGIQVLISSRNNELSSLSVWGKITLLDLFHFKLNQQQQKFTLTRIEKELEEVHFKRKYALTLLRVLKKTQTENEELLRMSVAVVERNLKYYDVDEILDIMESLRKIKLHCPDILDKISKMFIDSCTEWLYSAEVSSRNQMSMLSEFSHVSYNNVQFLEFVMQGLSNHIPDQTSHLPDLISAVNIASCFKNQSPLVQELGRHIIDIFTADSLLLEDLLEVDMLELCCSMVVLGIDFPQQLVSHMSDVLLKWQDPGKRDAEQMFIPKYHGGYSISTHEVLGILHVLLPQITQTWPIANVNRQVKPQVTTAWNLKYCIHNLLEAATVTEQVWLDPGLYADYTLEYTASDENSQTRLAVKVFPVSAYSRNNQKLKGLPHIYTSALQQLGYNVIIINPRSWHSIPEKERLPHLQHKVRRTLRSGNGLVIM